MACLAALKQNQFNPRISKLSSPLSLKSHFFFCTAAPAAEPAKPGINEDSVVSANPDSDFSSKDSGREAPAFRREGRRMRGPEKIEDIICRMMSNRAWTTRLQNSIRKLVPTFDHELIYNVLHRARRPDHALQFFRWVERSNLIQHNLEAHHKIMKILGEASMLNHARCILLDMPKKGLEWDEDSWVLMIYSYGKAGIVQESVKLFNKMKELGVERTVKSYDALFNVIMRRGRYMMSKRYFNKMLNEGIEPTRFTFNNLIWGFFLSGKLETANRFFEDMKARNISPNVITYNTMINGYNRFKKMEEAGKYFVEMKAKNIEPTVITYTTLIKGYASADRIDDALKLVEEMKKYGIKPNAITYSTLLPGLCKAQKMSEAQSILKDMVGKYIVPKDESIFMTLLLSQCKVGNLDASVYVIQAMNQLNVPTEAGHYGVVIKNCCKAGQYDKAVKLLDDLIEKDIILRPRSTLQMEPSAYNPLIEYLCSNGQTAKAENLMRQLMKLGVQDSRALNALIRGHSKEGALESASEILQIVLRRKVISEQSSYESLIQSYLERNEPGDAKVVFDSMIENGHMLDSSLYRTLMERLFEDGRIQTASRVMKTMLEKGVMEHKDLIAKIVEALLMRGHVEESLGRIELLMQNGVATDFDGLISVLCQNEKTTAALKLLDYGLQRDYDVTSLSYEKVLDALLASGKTLNAYSILCKIMEKGGVTDWSSCKDLIKSLNEQGNTKQADILSRMIVGKNIQGDGKKGKKKAAMAH